MTGHGPTHTQRRDTETGMPAPGFSATMTVSREDLESTAVNPIKEIENQRLSRDARRDTDQPMPPVDDDHGPTRAQRRGADKPQQAVMARRGKTGGMIFRGDVRELPPNDMRPREVDRKAVKAARKQAARVRRKRK